MNKLKRTTEEAAEYFRQQGCELLDEYKGCQTKMKYRCKCGRSSEIDWNHFTQGKRCGYCGSKGRTKKYTLDEVRKLFSERGCELLTDKYENNMALMDYRCECGNISKIRLSDLLTGYRCSKCGKEKQSGSNHWKWREDREQLALEKSLRKRFYKLLRRALEKQYKKKMDHTNVLLGYDHLDLKSRITNHPDWEAVKDGPWHIDHIFPIQAFYDHGITDLKLINCLENLHPMLGRENNNKNAKYNEEDFMFWIRTKGIDI